MRKCTRRSTWELDFVSVAPKDQATTNQINIQKTQDLSSQANRTDSF